MRTLSLIFVLLFGLTACGYRTSLTLPKPAAKPAASVPSEAEAK